MKKLLFICIYIGLLSGCASLPPAHDYSSFENSDPKSILVLPPINNSTEVVAPYSVMSQIVTPIAESGYYVFPVALVEQTFRNNGLTVANDVHQVPPEKLNQIFGADAALYITIEEYGTSYVVVTSDTVVRLSASLVDLKTGDVLWQDASFASSAETRGSSGGGLVGMLIEAIVYQIIETVVDQGFDIAAISSDRLLNASGHNGLLYGPRSQSYGQPVPSQTSK